MDFECLRTILYNCNLQPFHDIHVMILYFQAYGDFCRMECPANNFPSHTTLLQQPVVLNENTFVVIPSTRRPEFGDEFTFYASFSQAPNTTAYLLFYGTNSTTINFAVQLDGMIIDGRTRLTFQYYNNQEGVAVDVPLLSDGNEHCLLFTFPLIRVFVDDIQADLSGNLNLGFFELEASNFDISLGVSNLLLSHWIESL